MSLWNSIVSLGFVAAIVRIALPYVFAAIGGSIVERSGVIDLALEAKLLCGAFAAASVTHATGSLPLGIVAGAGAGAAVSAVQALCALRFGADQVVVGVGLNLLAFAGTRFALQALYGQGANSPPCDSVGDGLLTNPLTYLAIVAALGSWAALAQTPWGLRVRAAGERPEILSAAGLSIQRVRWSAMLVGGAIAGLGGAQLSLAVGGFSADMSSGRGYMALAAVILANWRPHRAALICLGIAAAEALNIRLQLADAGIPRELMPALPYALTMLVIIGVGGGRRPPPALGQPPA
ncbi:MAG: ABC transporter permease [Kofleriaceae bacterium]|nr:ABC transporter permease [Kofleriaceae bacterium]